MGFPLSAQGRVAFESVWEPSSMQDGQRKTYNLILLIPKKIDEIAATKFGLKGDVLTQFIAEQRKLLSAMYKSADELCQKDFKTPLKDGKYKGRVIRSPFRCGSEREHLAGFDSSIWGIRFSGEMAPKIADAMKNRITRESGSFFNGCWAHVTYNVYSYDKGGNCGIAFGLYNVQKTFNDEPFGMASSSIEDDFQVLTTVSSPIGGADDEELCF